MINLKLTRTSLALKYYRAVCLKYANSEEKYMAETFTTVIKVRKVKDHLKKKAGESTQQRKHSLSPQTYLSVQLASGFNASNVQ